MADDKRTTSAAKDVHLESYTDGPLTEYGQLSEDFQDSAQQFGHTFDQESEGGIALPSGHAPTPQHDMRPPPEIARDQDRETFQERQKAESDRSAGVDMADGYADFMNGQNGYEAFSDDDRDRGNDNDQGNDYSR